MPDTPQRLEAAARELGEAGHAFQEIVLDQQERQAAFWQKVARRLSIVAGILGVGLLVAIGVGIGNRDISSTTQNIVRDLNEQQVDIDALQTDLAEVRDFVREVQKRQDQGSAIDPRIVNTLEAVARIEARLCGGPCPPTGG